MKIIETIAIIFMVIFMNVFTLHLLKSGSILDPREIMWITGFFSGAIATRLLMELQHSTNIGKIVVRYYHV